MKELTIFKQKCVKILSALACTIFLVQPAWSGNIPTHSEGKGSYSGLFFANQSSRSLFNRLGVNQQDFFIGQNVNISTFSLMYPGKTFGWGIEALYLQKQITLHPQDNESYSYQFSGLGDIRFVMKYQFGIYRNYRFAKQQRIFKADVTLIGKLKLPGDPTNITDAEGTLLPPHYQIGSRSTDLTLGFMLHTDTEKYFRIRGYLTSTFPLSHKDFKPGVTFGYNLSFFMARLGIQENFYPFLAFKGAWSAKDRWHDQTMSDSGGGRLYVVPGIRSVWWYIHQKRTFIMTEAGMSIRVVKSNNRMHDSAFGFYFGTRLYFR